MTWQELGEGVYRRLYRSLRLNIGAVVGEDGVLVVDTRASHRQARRLIADVARLTPREIRWVVNTHWHWDHTFGNAMFEGEIWGHERCRERLLVEGEAARADALDWMPKSDREDLLEVRITPPDHAFADSHRLDIGGRIVELEFLGRGHTDNDVVVTVPDASVVFSGDLIEEGGPPYFGDSYPLSWADTIARLAQKHPSTVVPGHGDVVDLSFVRSQRAAIAEVGMLAREGWEEGRPWQSLVRDRPFPREAMRSALERSYLELST